MITLLDKHFSRRHAASARAARAYHAAALFIGYSLEIASQSHACVITPSRRYDIRSGEARLIFGGSYQAGAHDIQADWLSVAEQRIYRIAIARFPFATRVPLLWRFRRGR